jgi:hypothetical protein
MRLANRLPGLLLAALPLLLRSVGASPMGASAAAVSASAALATIATTARARAAAAAVAVEPSGETADEAELARNEVLASLKTEEAALEAQLAAVQARKKSLLASRRLRIGIVGFGPFGQFLAKTFVINNDVVAASRSDHSARAFELGASAYVSLSDPAALFAQQLDVLLISVSIVSFERTLAALTPYMEGRDVLVVDVLSVKDFPKKLFEERVPASCDILATHPMFGPESGGGPNGWRGLNFVCVNAAAGSPNNETETLVSPPVSPCLSRCAGTTRCASPTAPRRATGSSASSRCGRSKAAAWWR